MAGVRAIPITDEVSGSCLDCPIVYRVDQAGDARLKLMAHVKQSGHKARVTIHSVTELVIA
jgi:hypothetical protein